MINNSGGITEDDEDGGNIAIVGMGLRFPGASTPDQFWRNLAGGIESIESISIEELRASGVPGDLLNDPNYIPSGGFLLDIDQFDAEFFNCSNSEAEIMDPQHRVFLECCWEAIENSGYRPKEVPGRTGVFAGTGSSQYASLLPQNERTSAFVLRQIGNDKDYLTTRVAYKLNLMGPCLTIQTACSTSLVAVTAAAQSLLLHQCDFALAGGVHISVPQRLGYIHEPGSVFSRDGHCRTFDARGDGTVPGSGAGVVVLRRLSDARRDRDTIYAIVRGFAVNNDGAEKVGFTAPGVAGQAEVVREALALAGVSSEEISYVEAHGTGTALGDPIEVAALTEAFDQASFRRHSCALGSVKTNIGHLMEAAGIAGLIKATLALHHRQIPPTLHFENPNPAIPFFTAPFRVNSHLLPWSGPKPRKAGVNSFGIGGTNAHVVLEEGPPIPAGEETSCIPLPFSLSARDESALRQFAARFESFLTERLDLRLIDICWTACTGRTVFSSRLAVVASRREDLIQALRAFLAGNTHGALWCQLTGGGLRREETHLETTVAAEMAKRFVAGHAVDFQPLFQTLDPFRVPLPTYPFQRKRHWKTCTGERQFNERSVFPPRETPLSSWDSAHRPPLSSPSQIRRRLLPKLNLIVNSAELRRYRNLMPLLEELALGFAVRTVSTAFEKLDTTTQTGSTDQLRQALGVTDRQFKRFERLLSMVQNAGWLTPTERGWSWSSRPLPDCDALDRRIRAEFSESNTEVALLSACGPQIGNVLNGTCNPLELLFPNGGFDRATAIYQDALHARILNGLLRDAVVAGFDGSPRTGGLKVLEVGGGTGSTTATVLPHLNGTVAEYRFTDIGRLFIQRARQRFQEFPFLQYSLLNIEEEPLAQGIKRHAYDAVIAVNVLHATRSLAETLSHVRQLLVPGGLLYLLEITSDLNLAEMTAGLVDGWWRFDDFKLRPHSPILNADGWVRVLGESGFDSVERLCPESHFELFSHTLFVARCDASTLEPTLHGVGSTARQSLCEVPGGPSKPPGERLTSGESQEVICARDAAASVLGLPSGTFPLDVPLEQLGLDSLMAVDLRARMKRVRGGDIELGQIDGDMTVLQLADSLRTASDQASRTDESSHPHVTQRFDFPTCILPLQLAGKKRPFFCVHPLAGSPMCYHNLAMELGKDRPFLGIQSPGLMDDEPVLRTISEMAEHYVQAILKTQPEGPYALGGWSFGGFIAWEIAARLEARGKQVASLALIDGGPTQELIEQTHLNPANVLRGTAWLIRCLMQAGQPRNYDELRRLGQALGISLPTSMTELLRRDWKERIHLLRTVSVGITRTLRISALNLWAIRTYVPSHVRCPVCLYSASNTPGENHDRARTLQALSERPVISVPLERNHMSMILQMEGSRELGSRLRHLLDQADTVWSANHSILANETGLKS